MKKLLPCIAVITMLSAGALQSSAGSFFDEVYLSSGYNSKSGSVPSVPAGANVVVEASGNSANAAAYAYAYGGGVYGLTAYVTGDIGTSYNQLTSYADTISYNLWVSDYGYAFVEIDW